MMTDPPTYDTEARGGGSCEPLVNDVNVMTDCGNSSSRPRNGCGKAPAQWSTSLGTRGVGSFSRPLVRAQLRNLYASVGRCIYNTQRRR
eukprot:scaffold24470_cov129-Isochrysis_galbana.AAC.3